MAVERWSNLENPSGNTFPCTSRRGVVPSASPWFAKRERLQLLSAYRIRSFQDLLAITLNASEQSQERLSHKVSPFFCLTRVLGTPILFAFQVTGICRIVLVMQTCDLSESNLHRNAHISSVRRFHSPTYRAVSYIYLTFIYTTMQLWLRRFQPSIRTTILFQCLSFLIFHPVLDCRLNGTNFWDLVSAELPP